MDCSAQPSLTGIPSELRFKIYEHLFNEITIVETWSKNTGFSYQSQDAHLYHLLAVCKLIRQDAEELVYELPLRLQLCAQQPVRKAGKDKQLYAVCFA